MNNKLEEIETENIIIYIYYILLTLYLYANKIEVNYLYTKNNRDKDIYVLLLYIVFGTSFIIALYYAINNINELKNNPQKNTRILKELSAISSILILIASAIYIYIIYKDKNIDLEISP